MPEEILERQPFPEPGLAVRILGELAAERVALLQEADDIVVTEIKAASLYRKLWQSLAVLLPVKSASWPIGGHTCTPAPSSPRRHDPPDWVPLPYEVLKKISSSIVNEIRGINHVVYDNTSKPPVSFEWK